MEIITRIILNGITKIFFYVGAGSYATWLNLTNIKSTSIYPLQDIAEGFIGLVVGILTIIFLYYQILKIKKDIKNKSNGNTR